MDGSSFLGKDEDEGGVMHWIPHLILVLASLCLEGCEFVSRPSLLQRANVVSIGLNYQGSDVNDLGATIADARETNEAFSRFYGSSLLSSILLLQEGTYDDYGLSNHNLPTKGKVLEILSSLPSAELTIVTYSGHGLAKTGSLLLASPDGRYFHEGKLKEGNLLPIPELLQALSAIEGKVLLIMDSCYSGNAVLENGNAVSLVENDDVPASIWDAYGKDRETQTKVYALTAATANTQSAEPMGGEHGYFTEQLLAVLRRKESISLDELYTSIKANQRRKLTGRNARDHQHPMIHQGAETLYLQANGN